MPQQDAVFVDDANVEIGHQDEHALVLMRTTDADVVELASVAKCHRSSVVDVVASHSGLGEQRLTVELRRRLVEGSPRVHRRTAPSLMWPLFVVVLHEAIDL